MRKMGFTSKRRLALGLLFAFFAFFALFSLFAFFALPAAAREAGTVSVEVSVAPCVRVGADGLVGGNISTVIIHPADLLTVLPR